MADYNIKRIIPPLLFFLAIAGAAAVAIYFVEADDSSHYQLKAGINQDCTGIPWFVGEVQGIFSADGLDYVNVGQTVTEQRQTALALGQVDVLDLDPLALANMRKAGINVTAVAQSGDSPHDGDVMKQYMHWLALNDSGLTTFDSIEAANRTIRIGISAIGTSDDLQTDALLRQHNISQDKVQYVVIPDPNMQQALRQGVIDVAVLRAAFYACAEHKGGVHVLATSDDAFPGSGGLTLLVFKDSFIEAHPDTVRKFVVSYKDAQRWSNAYRDAAANISADKLGICTGDAHYYSESGKVNEAELQLWIDQMVADRVITQGELKPSDLYTSEFSDVWDTKGAYGNTSAA